MTELASRDGGFSSKGRVPFAPFHRMQTFPARKQVPHAVDSPRPLGPCAKKSKHVTWGENVRPDENAQTKTAGGGEESAKKKQVRRASSKGKLQWLFDQDRVYWESPQKESAKARRTTPPSSSSSSPVNSPIPMQSFGEEPAKTSTRISPGKSPWVPVEQLSDSVNIGEDELLKFHSSTDEESCNFDLEMSHLEMNAPEIQVFITTQQAPRIASPGCVSSSKSTPKGMSGFVSREDRPGRRGKKDGWRKQAAVLKAKCEVLRMEKELAKQRWKEGRADMAQAAEMAHSLRAAVESILEPVRRRGTVSEPCTPRRGKAKEELGEGLAERLHRLKASSEVRTRKLDMGAQIDLENQAKALHERIEMLQQRSQFRSSDSSAPDDSDYGGPQTHQARTHPGSRTSSGSSLPLQPYSYQQTIEEENKNSSNYCSLSSAHPADDAVYQLLKQTEDGCILEEELAKEMQTKETVRKILSQIQAEAEQWKQVQEVLKHVSTEMAALQQACLGWEKRALAAETLAANWQREGDEWRVKAHTAQQKIKELETQLTQLHETIEGVKQRHALEQNRWLDIGSGHAASNNVGYTLVLQPIANTSSSDGCRCSISKDQLGGCNNHSGDLCRRSRQEKDTRDVLEVSNLEKHSLGALRLPSPCRTAPREVAELSKVKQKYHNPSQQLALVTEMSKISTCRRPGSPSIDRGRSVSLERSRPRVPVRRASPARSETIFTENQENICGSANVGSLPKKLGVVRGLSPVRKSGQSPAPGCRGPSPPGSNFSAPQRAPLKDMRVNISVRH